MALEDERDLLASILADLGNFVESVGHLITDQSYSTEAIGFPVNQNFVPNIAGIGDALQTAAAGKADLPEYAAAAEKLAGLSDAVRLAVQAAQADLPVGMAVEEAVETLLDTVGLAYLTARHPWLMFLARAANLLVERLPEETVAGLEVAGRVLLGGLIFAIEPFGAIKLGWDALSNTETDDDARQHSPALTVLGLALALTPFMVQTFGHRTIAPDTFVVLHGWESEQTGDEVPLGDKISQRFVTIVLRVSGTSTDAGTGQPVDGKAEIAVTLALVPREHLGPGLWISLGIGAEADIHLGGGWHFVIEGELDDGIDMLLPGSTAPDGAGFVRSGGASGGTGEVRFEHRDEGGTPGLPATPWRLGGVLEAKTVELGLKFGDRAPNMSLTLKVREAALIAPQPDHGFFHDVLPSGLRLNFDLGVVLDATPRLYLDGGSGGSVLIPIRTGTPKLQGLHVYLELRSRPDDQTTGPPLTFEVSGGFATKLGGFTATVDRFGVMLPEASHPLPGAKWLKLPNAIGIGIASGKGISGGGFVEFEPDRGRYEGVLTLTLGRYTITAFGLISDIPEGYSLLIVASLEISPPWQGPFNIALAGLGAIIGHNHSANVPALQSALRTGAVSTILFPKDPIAAAPRVLTTLGNVFPVTPGSSMYGIGLKLSWSGGLVSLSAAVIIETGATPRTVILAALKGVAPDEHLPIIQLEIDASGVIDTTVPSVEFDGSLVNSKIGPFALTGDAAFRFHGGDDGLFLMAVGGFHPAYIVPAGARHPTPASTRPRLPRGQPARAHGGVLGDHLQLAAVRAQVEIVARKGGFSAEALLGFDVLVERNPFGLMIDFRARAAIRYDGSTLAAVNLDGHLSGPSPWRLHGKASLDLLFFSVSIPIDHTFGTDYGQTQQALVDAGAALNTALDDPANWQAMQPSGADALVALRAATPNAQDAIALHPAGQLAMRQDAFPFGIEITHIGAGRVTAERFDVIAVTVNTTTLAVDGHEVSELRAPFAAGEYVDLTDDDRLSRPAFEKFIAGVVVDADEITHGGATQEI